MDKADVDHSIASIETTYTLTKDWSRDLSCGIKLKWDYKKWTVNILMPGDIKKKFQEYDHVIPKKPQYCLYSPEPKQFGSKAQQPLPGDTSLLLKGKGKKRIKKLWVAFCNMPVPLT
jgi:hypothetical protein